MSRTLRSLAFLLVGMLIFQSCRVGEDDPLISLRSRKNRVVGDWNVVLMDQTESTISDNFTLSEVRTIRDKSLSIDREFTQGPVSDATGSVTEYKVHFDRNGSFEINARFLYQREDAVSGNTIDIVEVDRASGSWDFLGETDEFKNRENLILRFDRRYNLVEESFQGQPAGSIEFTGGGDQDWEIWRLVMLKNKEMRVEMEDVSTFLDESTILWTETMNRYLEMKQ